MPFITCPSPTLYLSNFISQKNPHTGSLLNGTHLHPCVSTSHSLLPPSLCSHWHHSLPLAPLPAQKPLLIPGIALGRLIASDQEHGLWSQTGLWLSVAKWPWASINFMRLGILVQRVIIVKATAHQRVILRTKSKAFSTVPSTLYICANIIIFHNNYCYCYLSSHFAV